MDNRNQEKKYILVCAKAEDGKSHLSYPGELEEMRAIHDFWARWARTPKENAKLVELHIPVKEYLEKYKDKDTPATEEEINKFLEANEKYKPKEVKSLQDIAAETLVKNPAFFKTEKATAAAEDKVQKAKDQLKSKGK